MFGDDEVFLKDYFDAVCEIWVEYQDGDIGIKKRDRRLAYYRQRLADLRIRLATTKAP